MNCMSDHNNRHEQLYRSPEEQRINNIAQPLATRASFERRSGKEAGPSKDGCSESPEASVTIALDDLFKVLLLAHNAHPLVNYDMRILLCMWNHPQMSSKTGCPVGCLLTSIVHFVDLGWGVHYSRPKTI